jgi:hypothetical protein
MHGDPRHEPAPRDRDSCGISTSRHHQVIMKTSSLLFIGAAFLLIAGCATAPQHPDPTNGNWSMMYGGDVSGKAYQTVLRSSDFPDAPTWSLHTGNPPVSIKKAATLATEALTKVTGNLKGWSLQDITLMKSPGSYWIYKIDFQGPIYKPHFPSSFGFGQQSQSQSDLVIFILMNGRVISPKPMPNTASEPTPTAP